MKKRLGQYQLKENELKDTKGAVSTFCGCGCSYAGSGGGSSIEDNFSANASGGKQSSGDWKMWVVY